jgi:hypothetical protein
MAYATEITMSEEQPSDDTETDENPLDQLDRSRGILTQGDRELLTGNHDYDSEQKLRNARYRLREHVRHSLLDVYFLVRHLNNDELKKMMKRQVDQGGTLGFDGMLTQLGIRLADIKINSYDYITDSTEETAHPRNLSDAIANNVKSSIIREEKRSERPAITKINVDISIEREEFDNERILRELVHGTPTHAEFTSYLSNGDLERLRAKLKEHDEVIEIDLGDDIMLIEFDNELLTTYERSKSSDEQD